MRLLSIAALALAAATVLAAPTGRPWVIGHPHGHDAGAVRYSPLKQINAENVSSLRLA
jgi:glucose dehydrogenase